MDLLLVRRQHWTNHAAVTLRCACGAALTGWDRLDGRLAKCQTCERPSYELLKMALTTSGDALEVVIAARGVVVDDIPKFEAQGFKVLTLDGGRLHPAGVLNIDEDLTDEHGEFKVRPA